MQNATHAAPYSEIANPQTSASASDGKHFRGQAAVAFLSLWGIELVRHTRKSRRHMPGLEIAAIHVPNPSSRRGPTRPVISLVTATKTPMPRITNLPHHRLGGHDLMEISPSETDGLAILGKVCAGLWPNMLPLANKETQSYDRACNSEQIRGARAMTSTATHETKHRRVEAARSL
jgi:hypothetical protein